MSAAILQDLIDSGEMRPADLADLLHIERHSVYPYLADRELRYSQLRTLIRQGRSDVARLAFHANLFAGMRVVALSTPADDDGLDRNGDGKVDRADACKAAAEAMRDAASLLELVATLSDDECTPKLAEDFSRKGHRVMESIGTTGAILHHLAKGNRRRKARTA